MEGGALSPLGVEGVRALALLRAVWAPCWRRYGTHNHPKVQCWLARHRRFHLHFTPTASSWLNLVERWLRNLTDKRIRRGSFSGVPDLIAAIAEFIDANNADPKAFVWTASVEKILAKISGRKAIFETVH